jgi:hypothetical protein
MLIGCYSTDSLLSRYKKFQSISGHGGGDCGI